jgi:hypothetical protein
LQSPTESAEAKTDPRFLLQPSAQFVEGSVRRRRDPVEHLPQLGWGEFRVGSSAMRQGSDIAPLPLLAQQFVNEGFVYAKQFGDLPFAANLAFYGFHYAFSQV